MKAICFYILCITICLVSCGSTEENNSKTNLVHNDSAISVNTLIDTASQVWNEKDFEAFWKVFTAQTGDNKKIMALIDFPYSNGFERITQVDFEKIEGNHFIQFQDETNVIFGRLQTDDYLNYNLSELFNEKYGNLDNIYVVRHEDDPSGYYAYFKYFNDTFKLIGFEDTMDASH